MAKATITTIDQQKNTERTIYITFTWSKDHTDYYRVIWYYATGNGVWFLGTDNQESTVTKKSVYDAPSNATKVKVKVKPVAKTHKVNNKDTAYWTADWSSEKTYNMSNLTPQAPPVPELSVENYTLTAEINNLDPDWGGNSTQNVDQIEFRIVKDNSTVYKKIMADVIYGKHYASCTCSISAGHKYCARARAYNSNSKTYSAYTEYSDNVETKPAASSGITDIKATSSTSIELTWAAATAAKTYEIEYATEESYLGKSNNSTTISGIEGTTYIITGMESGNTYYIRVRAVNDQGESEWTAAKSCIVGKKPSAPTTWSSSTTVMVGGDLNLYWVHNSEDGSSQTYAQLELTVNGTSTVLTIQNSEDEDEKDKTSVYSVDTNSYPEGTQLLWRVRTRGILDEYSDYSVQRTVDIYAPPTLEISMNDYTGEPIEVLESFPFYITGEAGPNTQNPIGYHVAITANESYETINNIGNTQWINEGEELYSRYFDINTDLLLELSAGNVNLDNNISYTITVTVTMNTGLSTETTWDFTVDWEDDVYEPDCEISIDEDALVAYIHPYCMYTPVFYVIVDKVSDDEYVETDTVVEIADGEPMGEEMTTDGNVVFYGLSTDGTQVYYCERYGEEEYAEDCTLAVYRREYNGDFILIEENIQNGEEASFIVDPHPALDYARYRIVAISNSTGGVSYYDPPGYPVNEVSAVIQWDEDYQSFEVDDGEEDQLEDQPWTGSMLKLPYNIDVSDQNDPDVELINYIGRERPVSYYGTALNESAIWNMDIDKQDKETLYALRRLAIYMGDVYVREPSGSGYWANIEVSFSQKHLELVIPVTLNLTRVEGDA